MRVIRDDPDAGGCTPAPGHHVQIDDGPVNRRSEAGYVAWKSARRAVGAKLHRALGESQHQPTLQEHERTVDVPKAREGSRLAHLGNAYAPVEFLQIGSWRPDRDLARHTAAVLPWPSNSVGITQDFDHDAARFFVRTIASQAASTDFRTPRNFAARASE